jgi:hypothetical protein
VPGTLDGIRVGSRAGVYDPDITTFDENNPAGNSHLPKFYAGHAWRVQLCRAAEAVIRDFISFVSRKADL